MIIGFESGEYLKLTVRPGGLIAPCSRFRFSGGNEVYLRTFAMTLGELVIMGERGELGPDLGAVLAEAVPQLPLGLRGLITKHRQRICEPAN